MIFKIAVNSVIRGASSWLALIVASIALSVVVALSLGMIVAGASASGEAQQAFVSMGATALGFTVLTALASFRLVVGTCVRLQRQDVALWQIAGILPGTAHLVVATEIVLVTAVSAALGAALSLAMWPPHLHFVDGSGLPETDVLHRPLPVISLVIAVGATTLTSLVCGLRSARGIVKADLVTGVRPAAAPPPRSTAARVITAIVAVLLIAGTVTLYLVIAHAHPVTDPDDLAGILSSYAGMGLLVCLIFAILSGPIIRGLVRLVRALPFAGTAGFLASREASARPRLTQALVVPITLAAAAVGIMAAWINELTTVMAAQAGSEEKVNAPPRQMALLLGGPVIVACVCASAIVFATASHRRANNALLLVSGVTPGVIRARALVEAGIHAVICLVCAYGIVVVNDVSMAKALSAGPVPSVPILAPGWQAAGVVAGGIALTLLLLLAVTADGMRRNPVTTITGGHQ